MPVQFTMLFLLDATHDSLVKIALAHPDLSDD